MLFFWLDCKVQCRALKDAIKTDSNLIRGGNYREEQRLWALALNQTHWYLLCLLGCACKQFYWKEKLVQFGENAFSRLSRQIVLPFQGAPLRNFNASDSTSCRTVYSMQRVPVKTPHDCVVMVPSLQLFLKHSLNVAIGGKTRHAILNPSS